MGIYLRTVIIYAFICLIRTEDKIFQNDSKKDVSDFYIVTESFSSRCAAKLGATREEAEEIFKTTPQTRAGECLLQCVLQFWNVITMNGNINIDESRTWLQLYNNRFDNESISNFNKTVYECAEIVNAMTDLDRVLCSSSVTIFNCLNDNTKMLTLSQPSNYTAKETEKPVVDENDKYFKKFAILELQELLSEIDLYELISYVVQVSL
ncbi:uncharacterized protein LOC142331127 isoform X3 [Lycorma delicatula]|uniref:uncharacterized protein LOC142331127 isoform X3 n=1 Tax=Lycorma delicatula TaxID=130591 RepID=UPI003F516E00